MDRCTLRCPVETPWSRAAKHNSAVLSIQQVRTRCTLPLGHSGMHLGPDDSEWSSKTTVMRIDTGKATNRKAGVNTI
jgi:hypothetical protein